MRVLVHSPSLTVRGRMLHAAWGLSMRGHDVCWLGTLLPDAAATRPAPEELRRVRRARDAGRVDVVVGGADRLLAAAWAGWNAEAHAAAVCLGSRPLTRWGFARRAAWGMLDAVGFLDAADDPAGALRAELGAERLATWSPEPRGEPDPAHPDVELLERACERLAARQRTLGLRPAVFLDRDGTIVIERGYLAHADDIELLPGVAAALRTLRAAGYALVVVSNQSGVGRGLFPLSRVYEAMARLRRELRRHGVELDAVYFCPHRPDAGCPCRKPSPELLRRAAANLRLALRESAMVGDKLLDVETARAAGTRGVLVRTGYGRDEEQRAGPNAGGADPDLVANDLPAAVPWLVGSG